jgi:hypothetical protein
LRWSSFPFTTFSNNKSAYSKQKNYAHAAANDRYHHT